MDSSTDDSVASTEDLKSRTAEPFDNYSQQNDINNVNNDSQYEEIAIRYNVRKQPRYDNMDFGITYLEPKTKRRKLNNEEAVSTDTSLEKKYVEENKTDNATVDVTKSNVSQKAQHMMMKMGWKAGKGLGKDDHGRVEPIEAVTQHGRRGFGHLVPGLKEAGIKWSPDDEVITAIEDIHWLRNIRSNTPLVDDMSEWMKLGPKKLTLDDENLFCNPVTLKQIMEYKTVFDRLDKVEMRKARTRSNPYETIRSVNFLNRAAVKMANIDKACDFMFTDIKNTDSNGLLYFADVCAGPGGFSEYVMSRKKWRAKGFGFTLKNENDFTLDEFFAGPCETFHPFYGSKDNGDVYDAQNQEDFRSLVMRYTYGKGVHFMMSDGGFSVEGQENIQEILSKQLYLCQCLVALMIVRPGGHFVTKLFDLFTPFSVGLVYLMYKCFDSISIFKPNSSRPANSERYLICKRKRIDTQGIMDYLSNVNRLLLMKDNDNDVVELVPFNILEADAEFVTYIKESNDTLGKKQIISLLKIAAFSEDPTLIEPKQADMRKECLKYWNLPDKTRVRPQVSKPQDKAQEIMSESVTLLRCDATKLKHDNVQNTILNQPFDWYCMPCGSGPYVEDDKLATLYLGLGRRRVYRYVRGKWESVGDAKIELPPDTLIYAELVYEATKTGKYYSKTRALHIIDAYMLGGEDVSKMYFSQRYKLTKIFCEALWKPTPNDYICIRPKDRFMLSPEIHKKLRPVEGRAMRLPIVFELTTPLEHEYKMLDDTGTHVPNPPMQEPIYSAFSSVIFIRSIAKPWARHISQKTKEFYVFNCHTRETEYEVRGNKNNRPPAAEASFGLAFKERVTWNWPHDTNDTLNMDNLVQMIATKNT